MQAGKQLQRLIQQVLRLNDSSLGHSHDQRGTDTMTGDVTQQNAELLLTQFDVVVLIATKLTHRDTTAKKAERTSIYRLLWQKLLLYGTGH